MKQPLFGSRKDGNPVRIAVKRIRLICVTIELLTEQLTLIDIQNAEITKKLFCSRFAKMIATILNSMGVSDGKTIFVGKTFRIQGDHLCISRANPAKFKILGKWGR